MDSITRRRLKATWIPGTVRRYESLWMLMHKFLLLNRPARVDLREIFSKHRMDSGCATYLSKRKSIGLFSPSLNLRQFAAILGEPIARLRYCTGAPFAKAAAYLFDAEMRFCPACLQAGYHTVLFAARGMLRCALHDCLLQAACPGCKQPFSTTLSDAVLDAPGCCQCGHVFLPNDFQVMPCLSNKELRVFDPLVRWLSACVDRVWFDVADYGISGAQVSEKLASHMRHWPVLLGVQHPVCLSSTLLLDVVKIVVHEHSATDIRSSHGIYQHTGRPNTAIYKSLRRYLTKTFLHNRTGHCFALANMSASGALPCRAAKTNRAMYSFVLLLWRQRIEGWTALKKWIGPWVGHSWIGPTWQQCLENSREHEIVRVAREQFTRVTVPDATPAESEWLERRLFAEGLLAMWYQTIETAVRWGASEEPYFGQVRATAVPFSACTCLRKKNGVLALLLPAPNVMGCI